MPYKNPADKRAARRSNPAAMQKQRGYESKSKSKRWATDEAYRLAKVEYLRQWRKDMEAKGKERAAQVAARLLAMATERARYGYTGKLMAGHG